MKSASPNEMPGTRFGQRREDGRTEKRKKEDSLYSKEVENAGFSSSFAAMGI